jgi:hypothetical protein
MIKKLFTFFKKKNLSNSQIHSIFLSEEMICFSHNEVEKKFKLTIKETEVYEGNLKKFLVMFNNEQSLSYFKEYYKAGAIFPPPWVYFPKIESISIFYREGIGQDYLFFWLNWLKGMNAGKIETYLKEYNINDDWKEFLSINVKVSVDSA